MTSLVVGKNKESFSPSDFIELFVHFASVMLLLSFKIKYITLLRFA